MAHKQAKRKKARAIRKNPVLEKLNAIEAELAQLRQVVAGMQWARLQPTMPLYPPQEPYRIFYGPGTLDACGGGTLQ